VKWAEQPLDNEQPGTWEQVWQGTGEAVAEIVAGRLHAEGIPANVRGHSFQQRALVFALQGAWAVYVPGPAASLARDVLRAHGEADNIIEAESPSGLTSSQSATLKVAFIGLLLIAIAGIVAAIRAA